MKIPHSDTAHHNYTRGAEKRPATETTSASLVAALGGPEAPVGGTTAQALVDAIEGQLHRLTQPTDQRNRARRSTFWEALVSTAQGEARHADQD